MLHIISARYRLAPAVDLIPGVIHLCIFRALTLSFGILVAASFVLLIIRTERYCFDFPSAMIDPATLYDVGWDLTNMNLSLS